MPMTVLLIDDDEVDRRALRRALGQAPIDVDLREATTVHEALAQLEGGGIDCAILDYRLPGADGIELLSEVRMRHSDVPVIALTGQGDEELAVELMKAGAVDYLAKEWVTPDRVERSLRHALAMAEADRLQTELLRREHEARQDAEAANRAKDRFLATLSHELRTPLGAILGWTHLLESGTLAAPTVERALAIIARNARILSGHIDDLLDISRISAGTLTLDTQPLEIVPLLESAIDTLHPTTDARHLHIELSVTGEAAVVDADPARLTQVFANLLANAAKYSPEGGIIHVDVTFLPTAVQVAVRDAGVGIDPAFMPHVFEPFRQADSTNTRRYGGLGLGLSIVERIVALHGGSAKAESDGAGRGATFTVLLPLGTGRTRSTRRSAADGHDLAGVRVLIVDDDEDALQLLAALLRRRGAQVSTAASALTALARRREVGPDVLVSDLSMPDRDGYWLIEHIRADEERRHVSRLPAAAVTALTESVDRSRALAAGFDAHVPKPVDPARLVELVGRLAASVH